MGMSMSLNQMDMNVVMYPVITGEAKKHGMKSMEMDDMKGHEMKMDEAQYNSNELSDIVTLNLRC
jgi:hypothetical protein